MIVFVTAEKIDEALELYKIGADYVLLPKMITGELGFNLAKRVINDKKQIKTELDLNPDLDTVLLMTGAHGVGRVDIFTKNLFENIDKKFQVIALTGKNKRLKSSLEKLEKKYPGRIKAVGFTDEVSKYMAACDFAITKTGGLTTSECLAVGLPIVTINPIPGMEERNTDYNEYHRM